MRGAILFEGIDMLGLPEAELERLRGRRIGMVYQDPNTSLNPALPLGEQVAEMSATIWRRPVRLRCAPR